MKIITVKDSQQGGKAAFKIFATALKNGAQVFGLATGSTPLTTYQELVSSNLDFTRAISINLDEYIGLKADDPRSYHAYMQKNLFNLKKFKQSFLPQGDATDEQVEVERYNQVLAAHPIDLQLLGIGQNGHIGFNEPGSSFGEKTRKVALTASTIEANSRFFENEAEVPRFAYSMGIGSILQAKQILLEAYGSNKAAAVAKMIQGPVTVACPASALQKHPNVTVIIDQAAAAELKN
ncbi:glucosamine-6-phosphate deaminase [Liquorilactobacillus sicerae]|uniref:glucosamine-6-phosphate deaminase n=1 Tax=Liquorilactobacillus sicerae TaxID=1416943 RepID=UPI002480B179|nr:glucosamine-6-phosphate deaminase [Liquorilactobacillus sicerae]